MEGFGEVVSGSQFLDQHCPFEGVYRAFSMLRVYRIQRHVPRAKLWCNKGGIMGSGITYWSSAMSSRVRVSNREWISALERTVSGIMTTGSE